MSRSDKLSPLKEMSVPHSGILSGKNLSYYYLFFYKEIEGLLGNLEKKKSSSQIVRVYKGLTVCKNALKEKAKTILNWINLFKGMLSFNKTGKNSNKAYQAMIRLHGRTNGRSTHWIANRYSTLNQQQAIKPASGILGNLTEEDIARINQEIKEKGFYVFDQVVSASICNEIVKFALNTPARIETEDQNDYQDTFALFDPTRPISKTYKIPEEVLITSPVVQDLMADPSLRAIVRAYVRAEPVLASVNTWFSPAFHGKAKNDILAQYDAAAQSYHFDMSRCRWLNFFLYLEDVNEDNGPHCFIKGSHHPKIKKAHPLLKRGYVRIPNN